MAKVADLEVDSYRLIAKQIPATTWDTNDKREKRRGEDEQRDSVAIIRKAGREWKRKIRLLKGTELRRRPDRGDGSGLASRKGRTRNDQPHIQIQARGQVSERVGK